MNNYALYYYICMDVLAIIVNCLCFHYAKYPESQKTAYRAYRIFDALDLFILILGGAFGSLVSDIFLQNRMPKSLKLPSLKNYPKSEREEKKKEFMKIKHQYRKECNRELLSPVFDFTWLLIHIVIYHLFFGPKSAACISCMSGFYADNKVLCLYYTGINVITFILMGLDKIFAMRKAWRIKETVLLALSCIGGAAGTVLAMNFFNHKVKSEEFSIGIPHLLCAQFVFLGLFVTGLI